MAEFLLDCPFCNGKASPDTDGKHNWIICLKCGAMSHHFMNDGNPPYKAVKAWNKRDNKNHYPS